MPSKTSFAVALRENKAAGEDFEWYPTTDEIVKALIKDIRATLDSDYDSRNYRQKMGGFLDIGAGDGRILEAVRRELFGGRESELGPLHAIEKSAAHQARLAPDVYIAGCDFWQTSLIGKEIGFIFTNPPYSEVGPWVEKLLTEMDPRQFVWLVAPDRWFSTAVQEIMGRRKIKAKIVGNYDFNAGARQARARVQFVRFFVPPTAYRHEEMPDPFEEFFNREFPMHDPQPEEALDEQIKQEQVVRRVNLVEALAICYERRMQELRDNYKAIASMDAQVLEEFNISRRSIMKSLKDKLANAKKEYWVRLFDGMSEITSRLTSKSRRAILDRLNEHTGVEFNRDNAYAIVMWAVRNANEYLDQQLIETYEQMVDSANIEGYVSNQRVFKIDRFGYHGERLNGVDHYRLKVGHRIVLTRMGGLRQLYSGYGSFTLTEHANEFLCDLLVVAAGLGFDVLRADMPIKDQINDQSAIVVRCRTPKGMAELLRFRAFQNGNLHIQMLPDLVHRLNTQHGRLKGWLRNDAEVAEELEIPLADAIAASVPTLRVGERPLRLLQHGD